MIDKDRKKTLTIISLGAGVQSSAMAIMAAKGDFPSVDCAIFADTGYEPKAVYKYLDFLKKILPYPIHIVAKGNIKDDMINSTSSKGIHFLCKNRWSFIFLLPVLIFLSNSTASANSSCLSVFIKCQ